MAMTWGFLALCVLIGGIVWITGRINIKRAEKTEDDLEQIRKLWSLRYHSKVSSNGNGGTGITRDQMPKLNAETLRQDSRAMKSMTLLSLFFVPMSFIATVLSTSSLSLPDAQESIAAKYQQQNISSKISSPILSDTRIERVSEQPRSALGVDRRYSDFTLGNSGSILVPEGF